MATCPTQSKYFRRLNMLKSLWITWKCKNRNEKCQTRQIRSVLVCMAWADFSPSCFQGVAAKGLNSVKKNFGNTFADFSDVRRRWYKDEWLRDTVTCVWHRIQCRLRGMVPNTRLSTCTAVWDVSTLRNKGKIKPSKNITYLGRGSNWDLFANQYLFHFSRSVQVRFSLHVGLTGTILVNVSCVTTQN